MPLPPWAAGPSSDPTTARVRDEACRILVEAGPIPVTGVLAVMRRTVGPDVPPLEWLVAALLGDRRLWRLPDGRWLHLPSALDGRLLSCRPSPAAMAAGVLLVDIDLATALLPFRGWDRVPVSGVGGRGIAERARSATGGEVLVVPVGVLPAVGAGVLVAMAGPEGLDLTSGLLDEVADLRTHRALGELVAVLGPDPRSPRRDAPGPHDPAIDMTAWPRRWSATDIELVLLAVDGGARRSPERPLSEHLAELARVRPAATLIGA